MTALKLKIITPRKVVVDEQVTSVTAPAVDGEITVLPHHTNLLSLLQEGIVTYRSGNKEELLAIGGGYLETDGEEINILVSRAYRQDDIDEVQTQKAYEEAKRLMDQAKDNKERVDANSLLRRSIVDMKLLKRRRKAPSSV